MNVTFDYNYCFIECPKNCKQQISYLVSKAKIDNFVGDSYLKVEKDKAKQYSYQAESELSIIQYFADLGGLFGLYLGISFIEIGKLINYSISFTKKILNYFININNIRIISKLKRSLLKLNFILIHFERVDFTIITKLIFPPILIYQIYSMFNLYFQYSTQTNYEFIPYNMSDNKYSLNEFPAISVCNEQLFDKIWFKDYYDPDIVDIDRLKIVKKQTIKDKEIDLLCENGDVYIKKFAPNFTNDNVILSLLDYFKNYYNYYFLYNSVNYQRLYDQGNRFSCQQYSAMADFIFDNLVSNDIGEFEKEMLKINDKNIHGLNGTKKLLDFYGQHYHCVTNEPTIDCSRLGPKLGVITPLGKCHTFLSKIDTNQTYVRTIEILINTFIDFHGGQNLFMYPQYLRNTILLHEKLAPPSDKSIEIIPYPFYMFYSYDMAIGLKKIVIKRLEKPYDTQCYDYRDSNQIDCMSKCYSKMYLDNFGCLPNGDKYHTFVINDIEKTERKLFCQYNFTVNNNFEKMMELNCKGMCGSPCIETFYHANIEEKESSSVEQKTHIYFKDRSFTKIEYKPKLALVEFMINVFNIWNFWHGTNFINLLSILIKYSKKLITRLNRSSFSSKKIIKIISWTLFVLFSAKLISLTIEYFQFTIITKINLLDYASDENYPFVSFIMAERMPHFPVNILNLKSNFTLYQDGKISYFYDNHKKMVSHTNDDYSAVQQAEFILGHFNVSGDQLFDRNLLADYYLDGTSFDYDGGFAFSTSNYSTLYTTEIKV